MVGASMALALADTEFKIAVIEAFELNNAEQPSFDERTVALTYSSKLIYNAIGIWPQIACEAYPIKNIEVTNEHSFGFTSLGVEDSNTEALGYVVPTRVIGKALHEQIKTKPGISLLCPATVKSINTSDEKVTITAKHHQALTDINAKLVVLADGGRSGLLEQQGFDTGSKTYPQSALVSIISTNATHHSKAYEHFTGQGPLALLPLRQSDFALAWTVNQQDCDQLLNCSEHAFINRLQSTFGHRAGEFTGIGQRHAYPLSLSVLKKPYQNRIVVIGNAAHIVHPVAGQGFNLGLRDVGFLHQSLISGEYNDPGNIELLKAYADSRARDAKMVSVFTDGLIQLFSSDLFAVKAGRNIGLTALNLLPGIKRNILKRTMGLHGFQSKLAMAGKRLDR